MGGAREALQHASAHGSRLHGRAVHARFDDAELARGAARSRRSRIPAMRLKDKVAIVTGAGQTPGETIGNGRATAILFAREGARVLLVDRDAARARETEALIAAEGGEAAAIAADVTREADCSTIAATCLERFGRI